MKANTRLIAVITAEAALEVVRIAMNEAMKMDIKVSVSVVGPDLNLLAFIRMDGATPHSVETSRRKANTSASTGRATGWMKDSLALELPLGSGNLLTNLLGGMPLYFKGALAAGLGIAGGTVEQDAAIADATLRAMGADLL